MVPGFPVAQNSAPTLVWNGSSYAVACVAEDTGDTHYMVYFLLLDPLSGNVTKKVKVSFVSMTEAVDCFVSPSVAFSGNGYAVAWSDSRNGNWDVFATLLDASGNISYHDITVCNATNNQDSPVAAWSQGQGAYVVAWEDYRSGKSEIYDVELLTGGTTTGDWRIATGTGDSLLPSLTDTGDGLGIVWNDSRDGNDEIYFARLRQNGDKLSTSDLNVSSNSSVSLYPVIVWTGAEYGVFWYDEQGGNYDLWFQRVSASGASMGSNMQVTISNGMYDPRAAFAQYGYLVAGAAQSAANFIVP